MKKFLSLMLAVLLLVSALPFAAFATETATATLYIEVKDENGTKIGSTMQYNEAVVGETYDADDLFGLAKTLSGNDFADYEAVSGSITIAADKTNGVVLVIAEKEEPTQPTTQPTEPAEEPTEAPKPTAVTLYIELKTAEGTKVGVTKSINDAVVGKTYSANEIIALAKTLFAAEFEDYDAVSSSSITISADQTNGRVVIVEEKEEPTQPTEPSTEATEPVEVLPALKFHYKNANGTWTSSVATIKNGDRIRFPEIPSVSGLKHVGWEDMNGEDAGYKWYTGMPTEYKAIYVESVDDGLVDLTIYAYYYVDGEYHHKAKLHVEEFEESKHNNMVPWIYDEGVEVVRAALNKLEGADGYQWAPTKFYNCFTDGEVSHWDDLKADGNKSVYVKVESKKAIEATILLHIHTAKEYAIARTVKMPGYTKGDFVSYNEVLAKVKNYYTGSNLSMSDLYSESDWEDLMDGLKSSGSKTIKVEDNGTTEIHVIVKNATSKTSSNADTSNPKTGDYITIAVGTMAMAAAALVTLAELKKRKMI